MPYYHGAANKPIRGDLEWCIAVLDLLAPGSAAGCIDGQPSAVTLRTFDQQCNLLSCAVSKALP